MSQPKEKIKFSRLRLSQKQGIATNVTGVRSLTLSANRTHISNFFQKSNEVAADNTEPSTTIEEREAKIKEQIEVNDGIERTDRKRKSESSIENASTLPPSNDEHRNMTPKKVKMDTLKSTQNSVTIATKTRTNRAMYKTAIPTTSEQIKPETITSFFACEKDDSFQDFQLNDKPIPKSKANKANRPPKKKASSRKKQPDIRTCLQRPCSEETFHQLISDHCALDDMDPDQLQMALAMSRSLAEDGQIGVSATTSDSSSSGVSNSVKQTIEKFRFKSRLGDADFTPFFGLQQARGRGKKWQNRCTALTRRKDDIQAEKIKEKVQNILMESIMATRMLPPEIDCPAYEISSEILPKYLVPEKILFKANTIEDNSAISLAMYYTNNLVSPAKVKSGVLLRDWALIPGRDCLFDCVPNSVRQMADTAEISLQTETSDAPNDRSADAVEEESDLSATSAGTSKTAIVYGTHEPTEVSADMENTILLDKDDIQGKLHVINAQIRESQLLNTSAERCETMQNTSADNFRRRSRESSPDLFADCDIDSDDDSCDSDAKNDVNKLRGDRNSEELCDLDIPETPTSGHEAIEIISISSSSEKVPEIWADSQSNPSEDFKLCFDIWNDCSQSAIPMRHLESKTGGGAESPTLPGKRAASTETMEENQECESQKEARSFIDSRFDEPIENKDRTNPNDGNSGNKSPDSGDADSSQSPKSPGVALPCDSIELSDDDMALTQTCGQSAASLSPSAVCFNRTYECGLTSDHMDVPQTESPLRIATMSHDSIEISDDEMKVNACEIGQALQNLNTSVENKLRTDVDLYCHGDIGELCSSQNFNLTQDSIEISDDEINYSMNRSEVCNRGAIDERERGRSLAAASQESIELSDDEINCSLKQTETMTYNSSIDAKIESIDSWKPSLVDLTQEISDGDRAVLINDSWTKLVNGGGSKRTKDSICTSNTRTPDLPSTPSNGEELGTRTALSSMLMSESVINEFENSCMMDQHTNRLTNSTSSRHSIDLGHARRSDLHTEANAYQCDYTLNSYNDLIPKTNAIASISTNFLDDCNEIDNDDIADEDLVNQSVSKIFESSFTYKKHTPMRTPIRKSSIFRKTQSEVFSDHHFEMDLDIEMGGDEELVPHTANESPLAISSSQYQKLSDEFDKLVYGSPECSSKVISKTTPLRSDTTGNQSQRVSHDNLHLDMSNENYIIKIGNIPPKPDYDGLAIDEILEELKKFGLKLSLKRRQAIICLEHIYNRTHPYVEYAARKTGANLSRRRSECVEGSAPITQSTRSDARYCEKTTDIDHTKINFNIGFASDNIVAPFISSGPEDEFPQIFLPSYPRAKKPWCLQPLHIAWYNLLRANSVVNQHVLLYRPISLNDLKLFFKSIDMNFENKDMIAFLDIHCITFQTNKANKN